MFNQNSGYSLADIAAATGNGNNNDGGWGEGGAWWIIILFLFVFCGWGNGGWGNGNNGGAGMQGALTRADLCQDMNFGQLENGVRGVQQGLCDGFYAQNTNALNGFASVQNTLASGFAGVDNAVCTLGYQTQAGINSVNVANMQNTNTLQQDLNAMNIANMQNANAAATQLADCCCKTQSSLKDIQFQNAQDACATTTAIAQAARDIADNCNANYRALHEEIVANRIEDKNATIAAQNQQIFQLQLAASQAAQNNYLVDQLRPCPQPSYIVCNPFTGQYGGYSYGNCGNSCGSCCG